MSPSHSGSQSLSEGQTRAVAMRDTALLNVFTDLYAEPVIDALRSCLDTTVDMTYSDVCSVCGVIDPAEMEMYTENVARVCLEAIAECPLYKKDVSAVKRDDGEWVL
ncbi:hypothetical protein KIPB_016998, partial [Kipferlia bialata]|eukprot:g16998.t1